MNVYTYYEEFGWPERRELLNLWRESWYRNGWSPVVLTRKDVEITPGLLSLLKSRVESYPTANDRNYELACYIRHLAMANVGGGLMTDFDVLNYGFKQSDSVGRLGFLDNKYCPGAIIGPASFYLKICLVLASWDPGNCEEWKGKLHLSDMVILRKCEPMGLFGPPHGICCTVPDQGWQHAPLVHFPTGVVPEGESRIKFIADRSKEWEG